MSRFEKFQNTQVSNEKGEPLYGQIYFHDDCIINFENGYISNWDNETEGEIDCPAISYSDGYMEFWENGQFKKEENFGNEKTKERNKKMCKEMGVIAETAFAEYLNKEGIPFIHLDQPSGALYSAVLRNKGIKRPDYIIFIDKKPCFIDVKLTGCYTIDKDELKGLNALKNEFSINVIFAVTNAIIDKNKKEFNDFSFMSLDTLNNYVKILENDKDTGKSSFYRYSKRLLEDTLIPPDINNDKLKEIYAVDGPNDKYHYSDILRKYLLDNNYVIE